MTEAVHPSSSLASRRRFLKAVVGAYAASSGAIAGSAGQSASPTPPARSRVVVVRDPGVMDRRKQPVRETLRAMVERGLCLLTGESATAAAWRRLISPGDVVGLKVNCLGGPTLCTHPALAELVAESMAAAGIASEKIIIRETW